MKFLEYLRRLISKVYHRRREEVSPPKLVYYERRIGGRVYRFKSPCTPEAKDALDDYIDRVIRDLRRQLEQAAKSHRLHLSNNF